MDGRGGTGPERGETIKGGGGGLEATIESVERGGMRDRRSWCPEFFAALIDRPGTIVAVVDRPRASPCRDTRLSFEDVVLARFHARPSL